MGYDRDLLKKNKNLQLACLTNKDSVRGRRKRLCAAWYGCMAAGKDGKKKIEKTRKVLMAIIPPNERSGSLFQSTQRAPLRKSRRQLTGLMTQTDEEDNDDDKDDEESW